MISIEERTKFLDKLERAGEKEYSMTNDSRMASLAGFWRGVAGTLLEYTEDGKKLLKDMYKIK